MDTAAEREHMGEMTTYRMGDRRRDRRGNRSTCRLMPNVPQISQRSFNPTRVNLDAMYTSTDTCISGHIELYIRWLEPHEDVAWWEQVVGTGRGKEERKPSFGVSFETSLPKGAPSWISLQRERRRTKEERRNGREREEGRRHKLNFAFLHRGSQWFTRTILELGVGRLSRAG
jgi:hypothetical protein